MTEFFALATSGFWVFIGVLLLTVIIGWLTEAVIVAAFRGLTSLISAYRRS